MVAWIAIMLSTISLAVNIIVQREKLLSFLDELKARQTVREGRKKALAVIDRFVEESNNSKKRMPPPSITFYLPIFFVAVISSGMLSYLSNHSDYRSVTITAGSYLTVSWTTLFVFLLSYHRFDSKYFNVLLQGSFILSLFWGILVMGGLALGLGVMWSGIVVGAFLTLLTWVLDRLPNLRIREIFR